METIAIYAELTELDLAFVTGGGGPDAGAPPDGGAPAGGGVKTDAGTKSDAGKAVTEVKRTWEFSSEISVQTPDDKSKSPTVKFTLGGKVGGETTTKK
jgi:hypothetical protein